jgi:drug/metabolite transporter (DMT)-like permease
MLVAFIMPVIAVILGMLFLGERIEPKEMAGAALIALGLLAIDGRISRRVSAAAG